MGRAVLWSAVVSLAAASVALPAQRLPLDLNRRGAAVERLHVWVDAALSHSPLVFDEDTARIAGWTPAALDDIAIDLLSLFKLMENPRASSFVVMLGSPGREVSRTVVYTRRELGRLRSLAITLGGRDPNGPALADDERITVARNTLLKRGAVMHTAIGLADAAEVEPRSNGQVTPRQEWFVQFADGRQVSVGNAANHWKFARTLLGQVAPDPSTDGAVLAWYRASSVVLLRRLQIYEPHFEEALRLFPGDAVLLAATGSLHEALASPFVQAFVRASSLPRGIRLSVGSARAELSQAESLLRRALAADATAEEPRLHLGRVLTLQGRYAEALGELDQMDSSASTVVQYYRNLFAGDAAQSLGRPAEARTAYERAATLYPGARTPWMALSQLAASAGDLVTAAADLDRAISDGPDPDRGDDPFWTYLVSPGKDAGARLDEAYRALTSEAR